VKTISIRLGSEDATRRSLAAPQARAEARPTGRHKSEV
jgi:hypothetical protein